MTQSFSFSPELLPRSITNVHILEMDSEDNTKLATGLQQLNVNVADLKGIDLAKTNPKVREHIHSIVRQCTLLFIHIRQAIEYRQKLQQREKEQKFLRIGQCTFEAAMVTRTLPGNWINDEIMNSVVHVVESR